MKRSELFCTRVERPRPGSIAGVYTFGFIYYETKYVYETETIEVEAIDHSMVRVGSCLRFETNKVLMKMLKTFGYSVKQRKKSGRYSFVCGDLPVGVLKDHDVSYPEMKHCSQ